MSLRKVWLSCQGPGLEQYLRFTPKPHFLVIVAAIFLPISLSLAVSTKAFISVAVCSSSGSTPWGLVRGTSTHIFELNFHFDLTLCSKPFPLCRILSIWTPFHGFEATKLYHHSGVIIYAREYRVLMFLYTTKVSLGWISYYLFQ